MTRVRSNKKTTARRTEGGAERGRKREIRGVVGEKRAEKEDAQAQSLFFASLDEKTVMESARFRVFWVSFAFRGVEDVLYFTICFLFEIEASGWG